MHDDRYDYQSRGLRFGLRELRREAVFRNIEVQIGTTLQLGDLRILAVDVKARLGRRSQRDLTAVLEVDDELLIEYEKMEIDKVDNAYVLWLPAHGASEQARPRFASPASWQDQK
jgi:hypothetical protein